MCIWHELYVRYALRIENTSESRLRSYEATKATAKKGPEKFWGFNGIRINELRDIGTMLHQLSYEASLEAVQKYMY